MILNAGSRTDIPAFYSDWFYNRVKEGYVLVRNPYYPKQVTRYRIDPSVVDVLAFCTKNPAPMLDRLEELASFRQFWFVTITPYGPEAEPHVPDYHAVIHSFRKLSEMVGAQAVGWRYDPIFITERYSVNDHLQAFREMASLLAGATRQVVISFIDLYEKTKRNFPGVRSVTNEEQALLAKGLHDIAAEFGMTVRACMEDKALSRFGIDNRGCMTREVLEQAIGEGLQPPSSGGRPRAGCSCLLGNDIGQYNTCPHLCRYCYANYDAGIVLQNYRRHDPASPLLTGWPEPDDVIKDAHQASWIQDQLILDI